MRFRRIYWVTEQLDEGGHSEVTGVFTSIPDLIDLGLGVRDISEKTSRFRISLCELDSKDMPLLTLESPGFDDFHQKLEPFLNTGEFSREELNSLADALQAKTG
jgi:hypothetical protein